MKFKISLPKIMFALLVVSLSIMIYSSSFFNVLYDHSFFEEFYEKNDVGEDVEQPTQKYIEVLAYLNGEIDTLQIEDNPVFADKSFTEEEIVHLQEVRTVISKMRTLYFISLIIFISLMVGFTSMLFFRRDRNAQRKIRLLFMKLQAYVVGLCFAGLVILWLAYLFVFEWSFKTLHKIFFTPDTWKFPGDSLSITLFPQQLYVEFLSVVLFNILMFIVMLSVLFFFIYMIYGREKKERKQPGNAQKKSHGPHGNNTKGNDGKSKEVVEDHEG